MKKFLIAAFAALALTACEKPPVARVGTTNPEIVVEELFTHKGCTVNRFYDHGNSNYYTVCTGAKTSSATNRRSCGKGCVRHDRNTTAYQEDDEQ